MHSRNIHIQPYDFPVLIARYPDLGQYVEVNAHGKSSIDFFNPAAVLALNKALILHHYRIEHWQIPEGYLCPPVPGRADYIHHLADLLKGDEGKTKIKMRNIQCLDIGTGANLIYPLLGNSIYGWQFVATEIDSKALVNATKIVADNLLEKVISLRKQRSTEQYFKGIIKESEIYALSMCNPPFHASAREAEEANERKLKNLGADSKSKVKLNFGGQSKELWCNGGEKTFLKKLILESESFKHQCIWFTALVSQDKNIPNLERALSSLDGEEYRIIEMAHGNKKSRFVAWTFFTPIQRKKYFEMLSI